MAENQLASLIQTYLADRARQGLEPVGAEAITAQVLGKRPTVNRYLAALVSQGAILREGVGPATRYRIADAATSSAAAADTPRAKASPPWTAEALKLRAQLQAPLGTRMPVTYRREFVDSYVPNQSSLLPADLAADLLASGRAQGQQPASTYARKVLEQLLIDLSWHSSRLEGNRTSLLDTQTLFAKGRSTGDDVDATMLLNHKDAIEFMVDAVPEYGITTPVVRNIQSLLMQGLLENPDAVGAIRNTVVHITDSVYVPTQVPSLLEEMLGLIVDTARQVKNPVEAAFFLWVHIAYLQPFEDGNKRTSRLCANLPLMLTNCAPLSFLDVAADDYAIAVTGVYERLDVTLAAELFAWTYRRSIAKYRVVLESMAAPDPFRARYREHVGEAIRHVVEGATAVEAIAALALPEPDQPLFHALLRKELQGLEAFNCARYRLAIRKTEQWIAQGRPT
ncbi:MAG: Fic family protein [Burkholderiales bacterium]|nr:Fic family protein [Burkholderiales bacterium]